MNYNLEAIRQLITNALTKDEFDDLVFFSFPSVEEKFINGQAQPQRIRILLEYVSKRRDIDKLLELIEQKNPTVYLGFKDTLIQNDDPISVPQPDPSRNLTDLKRQRLKEQQDTLQAEWQLRSDKLKRLRKTYAIEVGAAVKFQLEQEIQSEETELSRLETKLNEIEQNLNVK